MVHDGNMNAAILNLFVSLTNDFNGLWWYTINELTDHIHNGGVIIVPSSAVAKVLHANKVMFK
jgi:hypothetical protein